MEEILCSESAIYPGEDIHQICIYYDDSDIPIVFGSHYIKESMAYLIERNLFRAEERKKEFPYNACEMMCEYLYPELLSTPEIIIALCELSLMHYHSGFEFYYLVIYLKNKGMHFKDLDEFYICFNDTARMFLKNYKVLLDEIKDNVDFMYPRGFPYMLMSNEYVRKYYETGFFMRQHDLFFISSLYKERNPIERVKGWLDVFPLPMFYDEIKHELYGAEEDLSMMPVPLAILQFFISPSKGCPLLEYCKYSHIDLVEDDICLGKPWEQCNKTVQCPMAIYFTGFDIGKKKFNVNAKI